MYSTSHHTIHINTTHCHFNFNFFEVNTIYFLLSKGEKMTVLISWVYPVRTKVIFRSVIHTTLSRQYGRCIDVERTLYRTSTRYYVMFYAKFRYFVEKKPGIFKAITMFRELQDTIIILLVEKTSGAIFKFRGGGNFWRCCC